MLAISSRDALFLLEFIDRPALPNEIEKLKQLTASEIIFGRTPLIDGVEKELAAYFAGEKHTFATDRKSVV